MAGTAFVLALGAPTWADAPKFRSVSAAVQGSDLVISFREIGLGHADVTYNASALATSEYGCVNGGSNRPQAANKTSITSTPSANGTFKPKNGVVNGSLTLSPPGPGTFACPSGQTLTFFGVTYRNVTLRDTTNGVSAFLPGPYSS